MANLLKRLQAATSEQPLNAYEPEIVVEGSIITLKIDAAKVAEIAVERKGERQMQNGKTVEYTKNPAIMFRCNVPEVEVEVQAEDGIHHLLGCTFRLGQAGNGAYCTLTPTVDYGVITKA
jgi:hypothetical protein